MLFFLIAITVFALMYGYIGWRIIVPAALSTPISVGLWGVLVLILLLPFVSIMMRMRGHENAFVDTLAWIGYFGFGFLTLLFAILVMRDMISLVVAGVEKVAQMFGSVAVATDAIDTERRRLMSNGVNLGLLGLTAAMTGYGFYQARRVPSVVSVDLPVKDLPTDLDGFTIAQLTDVHVSPTTKRPFVETVVNEVNRLNPDLVALTGDLVDGSVDYLTPDVAPLAEMKPSDGKFFVTGNHEYYSGVEQWLKETKRLGFTNLMNEHRVISRGNGRLLLAGVPDVSGHQFSPAHRSDPERAIADAPEHDVSVLLAHQPVSIDAAARAGFDYVISGHTHGGQYFPYHFLVALAQPYVAGLHQHSEKTRIYVSRGTGTWGPQLRIGSRSEITLHRLVRA